MENGTWTLAEAKAKFSEVVERARTTGPQYVTRNGKEGARRATPGACSGTAYMFPFDVFTAAFYRPVKQQITARVDADVLDWLKSHGKGSQGRLNAIRRREMLASMKQSRGALGLITLTPFIL